MIIKRLRIPTCTYRFASKWCIAYISFLLLQPYLISDRLRIPTRTFCKQLAAPGWIAYILAPTTIVDLGSIENTYMHLSICKRLGAPRWFAYPSCSLDHNWSWIILISTRYVAYPKDGSMIGLSLCEYDGSHEF